MRTYWDRTLERRGQGDCIDIVNKSYTMNMIKRVIIKAEGVAIMANTSINIRMDADLKRQFEAFCADMGMTMTTAFNVLRVRL